MASKKHKEEHEEHADETWLVPYSDVLTLLLALFIVLFAMSVVDAHKFEQMSQSLSAAFNTSRGGDGLMDGTGTLLVAQPTHVSYSEGNTSEAQKRHDIENEQLSKVQVEVEKYISDNNLGTQLDTMLTEEGLVLVMREAVFFESGSATILPQSQPIIREIATILTTISQRVVVSGHTDNVPIRSPDFPSNWDLSTKRAVNFMRAMFALEPFLRPDRFSVAGYGEFRPVAENTSEAGRKQNRRVEIVILRNYPRVNK